MKAETERKREEMRERVRQKIIEVIVMEEKQALEQHEKEMRQGQEFVEVPIEPIEFVAE
jgi:hypothetical protein